MIVSILGFLYLISWIVVPLVILALGWMVYDKRYKQREPGEAHGPKHGFQPTSEVFIDPKDGYTYRVFYNPYTGERDYIRE